MNGQKAAIYLGGAFVVAMMVWATVAVMRSEGMLDRSMGLLAAFAVIAVGAEARRRRTRKP